MEQKKTSRYVELLNKMADMETAVAEYYQACYVHSDDKEFWNRISGDEIEHASKLREMAGIVIERKGVGFSAGRPFTVEGIVQFIDFIRERTRKVNEETCSAKSLFLAANEIEKRLLEAKYHEVLKTIDERYTMLIDRIVRDTERHVDITSKKAQSL